MMDFNLHETSSSYVSDDILNDDSVMAEYTMATEELLKAETDMSRMVMAFDMMESLHSDMTKAHSAGGVGSATAKAFGDRMETAYALIDMDAYVASTTEALESATGTDAVYSAVDAGLLGISDSISKGIDKLQEWIAEIVRRVQAFFRTNFSAMGRAVKRAEKVEEKILDTDKAEFDSGTEVDLGESAKYHLTNDADGLEALERAVQGGDESGKVFAAGIQDFADDIIGGGVEQKKGKLVVQESVRTKLITAMKAGMPAVGANFTDVSEKRPGLDTKWTWISAKVVGHYSFYVPKAPKKEDSEAMPPMPVFASTEKKAPKAKGSERKVGVPANVADLTAYIKKVTAVGNLLLDNLNEKEDPMSKALEKVKEVGKEARKNAESVKDKWKAHGQAKIARKIVASSHKHRTDFNRFAVMTINVCTTYAEKSLSKAKKADSNTNTGNKS